MAEPHLVGPTRPRFSLAFQEERNKKEKVELSHSVVFALEKEEEEEEEKEKIGPIHFYAVGSMCTLSIESNPLIVVASPESFWVIRFSFIIFAFLFLVSLFFVSLL